MAVGGALRAALKAGRFSAAGRESRRQARALADLNRRGGISGGPSELASALEQRGFERYAGTGFGATPRGNMVTVDPVTGARTVFPQTLDDFSTGVPMPRGPIESPLEGVRVWPGTRLPGFGEHMSVGAVPGGTMRAIHPGVPFSVDVPPPWMGRGPAPTPSTGRFLPRDMETGGGRMYDFEMGDLQGRQFFAPSIPVPIRPRFSFDDLIW